MSRWTVGFPGDVPGARRPSVVNGAMDWRRTELGAYVTARPVILPTDEQVQVDQTRSEAEIRRLVDRLCWHGDIDSARATVGEFGQTSDDEGVQWLGNYLQAKLEPCWPYCLGRAP